VYSGRVLAVNVKRVPHGLAREVPEEQALGADDLGCGDRFLLCITGQLVTYDADSRAEAVAVIVLEVGEGTSSVTLTRYTMEHSDQPVLAEELACVLGYTIVVELAEQLEEVRLLVEAERLGDGDTVRNLLARLF